MNSNGRKRAFGATIRTLFDITNSTSEDSAEAQQPSKASGTSANIAASNLNKGTANPSKIIVQHIPTLPRADEASSILARIHSEFSSIITRSKWNVLSITEMCCCSDGLDHTSSSRRKTRVMPNNVLGYNLTTFTGGKTHAIHLRLRHPKTHKLLDYESIAGTMCHELAHCVVGPHNAEFYKVMEEIEEQYSVFLTRGVVVDKNGFPVGSGEAHVLGGGKVSAEEARRKGLKAAEARRGLTSGQYVLGGSKKKADPREAARIAAERRLRDSKFCLPCNEVIEILGEDSDDEETFDHATKKKSSHATKSDSKVIDLTEDEVNPNTTTSSLWNASNSIQWVCACCTLINQPASLTCQACETPPQIPSVTSASLPVPRHNDESYRVTKAKDNRLSKKADKWTCPQCTFDNPSLSLVCGACCLER